MVDEITNSDIYFVCAQYRNFKDNIFYSRPSMLQKRYYLLRKFYKQTVKPACRWKENSSHFIELQEESEINNSDICDWEDSDKDVTADGRKVFVTQSFDIPWEGPSETLSFTPKILSTFCWKTQKYWKGL